jgi:hypothetical protein
MSKKMKNFSVRLEEADLNDIERLAEITGVKSATLIRMCCHLALPLVRQHLSGVDSTFARRLEDMKSSKSELNESPDTTPTTPNLPKTVPKTIDTTIYPPSPLRIFPGTNPPPPSTLDPSKRRKPQS